jgi:hypothetical protein
MIKMSISSMIREEVRYLAYSGEDINVRKLARKYNCSPSLVVKNIYKVEKEENFKHLTKYGVKGKVNLLIIDFENDYKEDEHLNERKNEDKNSKLDKVDRKISNSNKTLSKNNDSPQNKNISSDRIYKFSQDKLSDFEEINNFSPTENSHTKNNPSLQLFASQNSDQPKRNSNNKNIFFENSQQFNSQEKTCLPNNNSLPTNNSSHCSSSLNLQNDNSPENNSIYENKTKESSPSLTSKNNNYSPEKNSTPSNNPLESSPSFTPPDNNRSPQNNPIYDNNTSQCSLFNVHSFKKEKEKFSYNLSKEKEKNNNQKFINKFLGFQDLEILDIYKYQKEILKIYLKYGGRLRESDIKYGKGVLYYATPKQFEAILLKVIREKKGEIPPISYIYRVCERMDLKNRKIKETPKLFDNSKNSKNKKEKPSFADDEEEYRPLTSSFSYMGLTGEEALKAFFGECYKRENFIGAI